MTAISDHRVVDNLREALAQLEAEREELLRSYQGRIDSLRNTIAVMTGDPTVTGAVVPATIGGVGEDKLEAVREYVREKERVRQATVAEDLAFNTGTVSVALRYLLVRGEVRRGHKEHGSRVWEWVTPNHAD